jgi:uncharacterized damage-inducible protein DinB
MLEQAIALMTFYKGWGKYQESLREVIGSLTNEQLALSAEGHQWTIGQLIGHIIANRVWWFQEWMGEGSQELAHIAYWDPQDVEYVPPRTVAELLEGVQVTWVMIEEALGRWTAADLNDHISSPPVVRRDGEEFFANGFSREWIIWHVLEHEIYHGGELSLMVGRYGIEGIYGPA